MIANDGNELCFHFQDRRGNVSSEVLISTSWDADRQELDYIPLYILWNSPGKSLPE